MVLELWELDMSGKSKQVCVRERAIQRCSLCDCASICNRYHGSLHLRVSRDRLLLSSASRLLAHWLPDMCSYCLLSNQLIGLVQLEPKRQGGAQSGAVAPVEGPVCGCEVVLEGSFAVRSPFSGKTPHNTPHKNAQKTPHKTQRKTQHAASH